MAKLPGLEPGFVGSNPTSPIMKILIIPEQILNIDHVAPKLDGALSELRGQTTIDKTYGALSSTGTNCDKIIENIAAELDALKQCIHTQGACSA